jgi:hypothetical protein
MPESARAADNFAPSVCFTTTSRCVIYYNRVGKENYVSENLKTKVGNLFSLLSSFIYKLIRDWCLLLTPCAHLEDILVSKDNLGSDQTVIYSKNDAPSWSVEL